LLAGTLPCFAGPLLDRIRNYDLNDYAIGLAYAVSQRPYADASNAQLLYPYLTSFEHSAFNDNWLLIRGENVGLRFVTDTDWEFGLVGRLQTVGTGMAESDTLSGIEQREWAIETGPLVGWRRWPVHVQFRTYWEIPNRHSGSTAELEFSLPRQYRKGFIVPALRYSYLSSAYSDYYFGVSAREATPTRPAYSPGSSGSISAGVTFGYELAPQWLLTSTISAERLDEGISDSPIVARNNLWSASVRLAYNADIFAPRESGPATGSRQVEIRLGAFSSGIDTRVRNRNVAPGAREAIDLEDLLGVAERETVLQSEFRFRVADHHRLEIGSFSLRRRSMTSLGRDLEIDDRQFPAGTPVEARIESSLVRAGYAYSLIRDPQKELAFTAGIAIIEFETSIREENGIEPARVSAKTPLPTFGAAATVAIGNRWRLDAGLELFYLNFDQYDGFLSNFRIGFERALGQCMSAGLGYNFYRVGLRARDEELNGRFDLSHQGPRLYLALGF
jgi:outer membrane protein